MIQITNLCVNKSNTPILKDINLSFDKGLHIIMGPNGCGKSTLAYTIMGLPECSITKGDILLNNTTINNLPTFERSLLGIYLAPQTPPSIEGLSHAALLKESYNLRQTYKNLPTIDEFKFLKLLKEKATEFSFDPTTYPRHSFNMGFSGGEKKRNEMLQISLLNPDIIILDETDSGLDIDAMQFIGKKIQELSQTKIVILITHYPQFTEQLNPTSINIMKNGTFVKHGSNELLQEIVQNGFSNF